VATTKILKHTIEAAEPKPNRYVVFDSVVPGSGLRVYPTGRKVWVFVYRPWPGGAGTTKKTALIGTTDDFTPDHARKLADKMRAQVKTGKDPQAEKAAHRRAPTVKEVGDAFLVRHEPHQRHLESRAADQPQALPRCRRPQQLRRQFADVARPVGQWVSFQPGFRIGL